MIEVKVHRFMDGPFEDGDSGAWYAEVFAEVDGSLETLTVFNYDLDELYNMAKHFKTATLEPYVIKMDKEDMQ